MARNLVHAGFDVAGYARREETAVRARGEGIEIRRSLAELAADREVIVIMVTTSSDVEEVVLAPGGLLASAPPGALLIDMSTIAPEVSRRVAAECGARGIGFLDAPVSGGSFGAESGSLTIMVGGEPDMVERARPIFDTVGNPERVFHVGPAGSGEVVKLANNMLVGSISAATMEALLVAVRAGVDLRALTDVISVSSGSSAQLTGQLMLRALAGTVEPGFMTDLLVKDMRLAAELAADTGQATTVTDSARALFEAAQAEGHGREDYTALLFELEKQAGVRLRLK
jgi:3-hydroxyisobutyrate dehydrogenase-like beta-hydroxyacid dehydrogenase